MYPQPLSFHVWPATLNPSPPHSPPTEARVAVGLGPGGSG